jgi:hypothetical protein
VRRFPAQDHLQLQEREYSKFIQGGVRKRVYYLSCGSFAQNGSIENQGEFETITGGGDQDESPREVILPIH